MTHPGAASDHHQISSRARLIAAGTLASRVAGFVRDLLLAAFFDRTVTDCFVVAFRLPNLFRRILGEGAMASSLIPVLTATFHNHEPTKQSQQLVNSIWSIGLLILIFVVGLGEVAMPHLIGGLIGGGGFTAIPGKTELAIQMAQWMFPFLGFIAIYAFAAALLQSRLQFAWAAFAPTLLNLTLIGSLVWSARHQNPLTLSRAVLVGGFLQALILWPQLRKIQLKPVLQFHIDWDSLKLFGHQFGPSVLANASLQFVGLMNVYFASLLAEGSHSYLYWVDRLLEFPMSLVGVSFGSALLPALSRASVSGDHLQTENLLARAFAAALFWLIPFLVGMVWLAEPVIQLLYQRGHFQTHETQVTAHLLQIAALTLFSGTFTRLLQPLLFAHHQAKLAAVISIASVLAHGLIGWFATQRWQLEGLAWTAAASTSVHLLFVLVACFQICPHFPVKRVARQTLALGLSAIPFILLATQYSFAWNLLSGLTSSPPLLNCITLTTLAGFGFALYWALCRLLASDKFAMMPPNKKENSDA